MRNLPTQLRTCTLNSDLTAIGEGEATREGSPRPGAARVRDRAVGAGRAVSAEGRAAGPLPGRRSAGAAPSGPLARGLGSISTGWAAAGPGLLFLLWAVTQRPPPPPPETTPGLLEGREAVSQRTAAWGLGSAPRGPRPSSAGLTSLSKSWSGSDMLLRGAATPGSDPPGAQGGVTPGEGVPAPQARPGRPGT